MFYCSDAELFCLPLKGRAEKEISGLKHGGGRAGNLSSVSSPPSSFGPKTASRCLLVSLRCLLQLERNKKRERKLLNGV